ncbi:very-long-chain 3-oxoacyl-CoA reductase-like protein At1g24470 isoform X2 [Ricinus communis]|uniref:very-long-chain 3-oxoacyl-CoA reductase-like protein At1g24470 isoform X2 n=1 Tax=Ricinus communis TaxID=3988 RepID=UPI00077261A8|nr:very-long-chain 3-oxoacyl-CoA reductase-like protein At1g24470 isoform X2 [Ricinus communis]|eukprot:XP_015572179.1 very-long-chain 3-oxoacyl-CoA reductase-like protein At1g24470 [Ricinus communis]
MLACINHLTTQPLWLPIVSFLGFLSLLNYSFTLLNWVYKTVLRQPKNLKENYGSWALITGATDGIGKAFAFQLAKQGLNLILVSRNLNKLKTVSSEIQEEFPSTKIKIMNLDFSSEDSSGLVHVIEEAIKGVDVGVLINNVGITYPRARFFDEVDESTWMSIVKVNVEGTTRVTEAVLPGMIERRRGAIVNIGSGASIVVPSHPLYTIYAATKAYIDRLSRCLYVEYKSCGIDVQCQVPLYVATNMTSRVALIEKSSLFIPSPQAYAEAAVRRIGYEARCTPYWAHSLQWFFSRLLSEAVLDSWRLSIGIHRRGDIITSSTSAGVDGDGSRVV